MSSSSDPISVVTGGLGFIGGSLVRRLLKAGKRVITIDNHSRPYGNSKEVEQEFERSKHYIGNITTISRAYHAVTREGEVERVYHFAGQTAVTTSLEQPYNDHARNATDTLLLLMQIVDSGRSPKIFFSSTNKVYRTPGPPYVPINEQAAFGGSTPYGVSKSCADLYMQDYAARYGLDIVVLRLSCVYGPNQNGSFDQGWINHFARQIMNGEPITICGDGLQMRDLLHINDLLDLLLKHEVPAGVYNVGGGERFARTLNQTIGIISSSLGIPYESLKFKVEPARQGDPYYYVSDLTKIGDAAGWSPTISPVAGIDTMIDHMKENTHA